MKLRIHDLAAQCTWQTKRLQVVTATECRKVSINILGIHEDICLQFGMQSCSQAKY